MQDEGIDLAGLRVAKSHHRLSPEPVRGRRRHHADFHNIRRIERNRDALALVTEPSVFEAKQASIAKAINAVDARLAIRGEAHDLSVDAELCHQFSPQTSVAAGHRSRG